MEARGRAWITYLQIVGLGGGFMAMSVSRAADSAPAPPPNAGAEAHWDRGRGALQLAYHGSVILDALVTARDQTGRTVEAGVAFEPTAAGDGKDRVEQKLAFSLAQPRPGVQLVLRGTATGSEEAFPAETLSEAQKRFPYVRNSVGLSHNLRNNALYDRRWDWVLAGPADGATRLEPAAAGRGQRQFFWESHGPSLTLVFRPRFYQKHLGFDRYEPWTYTVWRGSVTGYCTWWAYRGRFSQETLDAMLKLFAEKHLPDFGYVYMQFDNCYQKGNGSAPWNWLNWDERKYPGGWRYAMKAIREAGMKPGIWVHRVHRPSDPGVKEVVEQHPDWFVPGTDGKPHLQRGFASLNTLNTEAVETMVRGLYRGLKEQGWEYVKIDGTGDLLSAYRNKDCAGFFADHATTPEQSLRAWDIVAREELGPNVYILACHTVGNAKWVVGLVDGARLSNDGFQPRTLAQYSYLEGVLWRNDADHCDVMGEWLMDTEAVMPVFGSDAPVPARSVIRPAICAVSGTALMLSDKLEIYQDERNIEGVKRSAPVLTTVPGQLYSCGRKPVSWWLQEIDRPFDHWSVLARIQWGEKESAKHVYHFKGVPAQEVRFTDLGLQADQDYLVFEFWSQTCLGKHRGSFTAPAMDENNGMQVFAIREARRHPWILSTTRHISQGGISLLDERWDPGSETLSGQSAVVIDDPYVLTVHLPDGCRLQRAEVEGEEVQIANRRETATVRVVPSATKTVAWRLAFAK